VVELVENWLSASRIRCAGLSGNPFDTRKHIRAADDREHTLPSVSSTRAQRMSARFNSPDDKGFTPLVHNVRRRPYFGGMDSPGIRFI